MNYQSTKLGISLERDDVLAALNKLILFCRVNDEDRWARDLESELRTVEQFVNDDAQP